MASDFYGYYPYDPQVEYEIPLHAETVIPCDYCDAPATGMVTSGEPDTRRFRCSHEDHRRFAGLNVRRMPARPRFAGMGYGAVLALLRDQYIRLRLPNWLSVAAKRARFLHEKEGV